MDLTKPLTCEEYERVTGLTPAPPVISPTNTCGKCGGQMEEGFIPDRSYSSTDIGAWYAGKPQFGIMGSVKTAASWPHKIRTYACLQCGFLESYIDRPTPAA